MRGRRRSGIRFRRVLVGAVTVVVLTPLLATVQAVAPSLKAAAASTVGREMFSLGLPAPIRSQDTVAGASNWPLISNYGQVLTSEMESTTSIYGEPYTNFASVWDPTNGFSRVGHAFNCECWIPHMHATLYPLAWNAGATAVGS